MAGYLTRSLSLSPLEPEPPPSPLNSPSMPSKPVAAAGGSAAEVLRMPPDVSTSPLKIFVLAKKKINDIFMGIADHIEASYKFLEKLGPDSQVITPDQIEEVDKYRKKIIGIREVLARDHMKVVFFGRTSNGKSTVINAMLQDKILPSGLGHTTNCFLQVEGSDSADAFLLTEDSTEPKNVQSVAQMANALNVESIGENSLVRIIWPKNKCPLLRDDVVLVDSPGIDVSTRLDEWIDKHCLDADVFILVANAESTLMLTEKNFFHKVNEKLSKPNIFILNNRWDASATEPEFLDKVRKQHMDRNISFLVDELNVATRTQAENRVFFVSAKEVLQARLQAQRGLAPHTGALAEGFQTRFFEFQDFERKFEESLSKTAVKTKFEQHTQRGQNIIAHSREILEAVYNKGTQLRDQLLAERKELWDRLEFVQQQHQMVGVVMKDQIQHLVEVVEQRVASALSEEIRRLSGLVADFDRPFHADPLVLSVYKRELHDHMEQRLGSNLRAKLSHPLTSSLEDAQKEMIERVAGLLSPEHQENLYNVLPRHNFEINYRLNCDKLCADFEEDLQFRFSLGIFTLMQRFFGPSKSLSILGRNSGPTPSLPPTAPQTPSNEAHRTIATPPTPDYLAIVQKMAFVSPNSQSAFGIIAIGGFLVRAVGWRLIVISLGVYGVLYIYERVSWTNKAKERAFKKQYVSHAVRKLRLIVDLTSSNCGHQVRQELTSTYARLSHVVDQAIGEMQAEIKNLDHKIEKLDESVNEARILRNKANFLSSELETFSQHYLQYESNI